MSLTDDMDLYQASIDFETLSYFFKDQTLPIKLEKIWSKLKKKIFILISIITHLGRHEFTFQMCHKKSNFPGLIIQKQMMHLITLFEMDKAKT